MKMNSLDERLLVDPNIPCKSLSRTPAHFALLHLLASVLGKIHGLLQLERRWLKIA
jgi:hypothetical protein